jgi:hypothetical protein
VTAVAEDVIPGVYDIPEETYHRDPVPYGSLSSTGARKLLTTCPAVFMHEQLNPPASTDEFDFGKAAHRLVLGVGPEIVVVDAKDWRTTAAKTKRKEAHEKGLVPILAADWRAVQDMAAALREHPIASALLAPERGDAEQTLIWQDGITGVWRRARLDFLPENTPGRMVIADYKTTKSAHPDAIRRSVAQYGYHQQHAWYVDGVRALGLASSASMLFVFQEKTAPYLVTVAEVDAPAVRVGRDRNQRALEIYRDCVKAGHWPGYTDEIAYITLPPWAERGL